MRRLIVTMVAVAVATLALSAGCASNGPTDACTPAGGVCVTGSGCTTESLPYPCSGGQVCCTPPDSGGGG